MFFALLFTIVIIKLFIRDGGQTAQPHTIVHKIRTKIKIRWSVK